MYSRISCTLFLTGRMLLLTLQIYDALIILLINKKEIKLPQEHDIILLMLNVLKRKLYAYHLLLF